MGMIVWALLFVAGWVVFGYGFARMRGGDHGDASKLFTLSATMFLVALISRLINISGG